MIVRVVPPLITAVILKMRHRISGRSVSDVSVTFHEYSTLDNPQEVPCQVESYLFCREKYLKPTDTVLDIGFGLGYGLQIMAAKAEKLIGIEVDERAVARAQRIFAGHPRVMDILHYDGTHLPFPDKSVDVVTCIEIIEHVQEYRGLLLQMARVARREIFISTPNRRPENTSKDGKPKNYWHLREWTSDELEAIFGELNLQYEWNFLNGPFEGPFNWTDRPINSTLSLVPVIRLD